MKLRTLVRATAAFAVALAVIAGLCTTAAFASDPTSASAVAVTPAHVALAVRSLDAIAKKLMRESGVPGVAIAVVYDDKVVYGKGFGVRKVGTHEKVDANTVFELASVSKPVGASVVAAVVGRGGVKWSDPIVKYIPGFALRDPWVTSHVTIADMYAHRSGLPDHAGDLLEDLGYGRAAILHRLRLLPLQPFRISYAYTNFGLTAGAQAVADAEHTSWENLSREMIYRPLGMTNTSSRYADFADNPNHATLHVLVDGHWVAKYTRDADAQSPAGGVSSCVHDMAQWMRMELTDGTYNGKQIVAKDALLAARMPHMMSNPPSSSSARASFYGYGIGVSYDEAGRVHLVHSGAFSSGAATVINMLPSAKLGIVVLTNGMPIGVPESIGNDFMDIAEFGKVQRDWFAAFKPRFAALFVNHGELAGKKRPEHPQAALPLNGYAGTYASAYYGPLTISVKNGHLVLVVGPRKRMETLSHWNGNVFSYFPEGENAAGISAVTFTMRSGRASSVTVEDLDENRLGTFARR